MIEENDPFEKFIGENIDEFNQEKPGDDLWKKIQKDLPKRDKVVKLSPWKNVAKIAATLLLFAGIASVLMYIIPNQKRNHLDPIVNTSTNFTLKDVSTEYAEVQLYYEDQISSKMKELNQLEIDEAELDELKTYDEEFKTLEKELQHSVDQQKIIDAMIQNYRIKIDNMDNMLDRIKNLDNTSDHEKNSTDILVFV